MRKTVIMAALVVATLGTVPAAAQNRTPPGLWSDALLTPSGRWSICRQRLEAKGYPYSYLRSRASRGVVGACVRALWRENREAIRAYYRRNT